MTLHLTVTSVINNICRDEHSVDMGWRGWRPTAFFLPCSSESLHNRCSELQWVTLAFVANTPGDLLKLCQIITHPINNNTAILAPDVYASPFPSLTGSLARGRYDTHLGTLSIHNSITMHCIIQFIYRLFTSGAVSQRSLDQVFSSSLTVVATVARSFVALPVYRTAARHVLQIASALTSS